MLLGLGDLDLSLRETPLFWLLFLAWWDAVPALPPPPPWLLVTLRVAEEVTVMGSGALWRGSRGELGADAEWGLRRCSCLGLTTAKWANSSRLTHCESSTALDVDILRPLLR